MTIPNGLRNPQPVSRIVGLDPSALIVESAQVFDTHHVALLVAAGASAVVPYLADDFADSLEPGGTEKARAAINAKMIATLTPAQQAKWKELTGEPFKGQFNAPFRRPGA